MWVAGREMWITGARHPSDAMGERWVAWRETLLAVRGEREWLVEGDRGI